MNINLRVSRSGFRVSSNVIKRSEILCQFTFRDTSVRRAVTGVVEGDSMRSPLKSREREVYHGVPKVDLLHTSPSTGG